MRVVTIGSDYVGLVLGGCFADFDHDVVCVDKDPEKSRMRKVGIIPKNEPVLARVIADNVTSGRLSFTSDLQDLVSEVDLVFIGVGTPTRRCADHSDLSYIYSAAREIGVTSRGSTMIVTKPTVPAGTFDEVEWIIAKFNPQTELAVAPKPELLREGSGIKDLKRPDRVVEIEEERARSPVDGVYRPLQLNR